MKNITIFTTFRDADPAYSLNRVVIDQLRMLLKHGYKPKVVVAKGFKPVDEYEQVECIEIPDVPVRNDVYIDDTFEADVKQLEEALLPILKETDVMITHDLVYQPAALKHNVAIRNLLNREADLTTRFLHWVHSATQPAVVQQLRGGGKKFLESCQTPFPRSFYIAFNQYSIPRIAGWFGVEESDVKYVPHPHDFTAFFHPLAKQIVEKTNLIQKDVIMIYPVRLDRGKQVEYVIKIAHAVKEVGLSVGCVIVDFHSTGGDKVTYRDSLKSLATGLGLSSTECMFASELDRIDNPEAPLIGSFPHQVVTNLFELSNTFVLPSKSETYSLVAQEAAATKNFCILNFDFPPMRSIYGEAPHYVKFSSNIDVLTGQDGSTDTKYEDEPSYWRAVANYIKYVQTNTRVLALHNKIRQERNLDTVFRKNLEPLLYADNKYNY